MLTPEDLSAIATLVDRAIQTALPPLLQTALEPVLARLVKLEHAVLKLEQRVGNLDQRVFQVRKRLDLLSSEIMTSRTREIERFAELESRVESLEVQLSSRLTPES